MIIWDSKVDDVDDVDDTVRVHSQFFTAVNPISIVNF